MLQKVNLILPFVVCYNISYLHFSLSRFVSSVPFFGSVFLRVRLCGWIYTYISLLLGARLVAPAVGAAYFMKCPNIALQAAQMGIIRYIPIYPYICPNMGKIGSLS